MTGLEVAAIGSTVITGADVLAGASTILGLAGAVQQSNATKAQGAMAQRNAQQERLIRERDAKVREQQASQERAVAQRDAIETRRQSNLAQSAGIAAAAASGGSALDPGVVDLLGDVEAEGEYRAMLALAGGEERARGFEDAAAGSRFAGRQAVTAGDFANDIAEGEATSQLLSGVARSVYGLRGFGSTKKKTVADQFSSTETFYSRYG